MTDNYLKFDVICKYNEAKEYYTGSVPSLGIEIKEAYSEGEVFEQALHSAITLLNGVMTNESGQRVSFATGKISVKMEIELKLCPNKTLREFDPDTAEENNP